MTDRQAAGMAEAARLLDDSTQQMTPVPPFLDEGEDAGEDVPAEDTGVDWHVL